MSTEGYLDLAIDLLKNIKDTQMDAIRKAGELVAECFVSGNILHIFGTGHSHMVAEEAYSRAGGLIPIDPMLEGSMMLHEGYGKSSALERLPGIAKVFFENQDFDVRKGDVALIVSNSGRNAAPVEMAMLFKDKGIPVIALTSMKHSKGVSSRAPGGKKLYEVADIVIDNLGVPGDAALEFPGIPVKACPTSTIAGVAILWSILSYALDLMIERGETPPIIMSGNLDEASEYNKKVMASLAAKYGERVPWVRTSLIKSKGWDK